MRQTTLLSVFSVASPKQKRLQRTKAIPPEAVETLVRLVKEEDNLLWYAIVPFGNSLKCISELLMRCSSQTPMFVNNDGISMVACDQGSGRLIQVQIHASDMIQMEVYTSSAYRCILETSSIHAVFHQLKRKDIVVLYANEPGHLGLLVDYSGKSMHTKYSTICVSTGPFIEYQIPQGYETGGVQVSSTILQRILREYKNLTKRIVLKGNRHYIHIAADNRYYPDGGPIDGRPDPISFK